MDIIDLHKEKLIRDCRDFLKSGKISDDLRKLVVNATPGQLDYLKKGLDESATRIFDLAIVRVRDATLKEIALFKQKVNLLCLSTLENLETSDERYAIPEVIERYRESINPVKALYYDLQEIIFLYDGKPKNKHHQLLIETFRDEGSLDSVIAAVSQDLKSLLNCKEQIAELRQQYNTTASSDAIKRVREAINDLHQWNRLFKMFAQWARDNDDTVAPTSIFSWIKKKFT